MRRFQVARTLGAVVWTVSALCLSVVGSPVAVADPCPDVAVVYARGTGDRPGFGYIGRNFINTLKWKLRGQNVSAYPVDYPANWSLSRSASLGARDANQRVQYIVGACPQTKIVLGGMSQGAGVIDLITIGDRKIWFFKNSPLPDAVADHVVAVAVFGNPSRNYPRLGPLTEISPVYGDRAIDLCAKGDPFCSDGTNVFAHFSYAWNGMVGEASSFVASKILSAGQGEHGVAG